MAFWLAMLGDKEKKKYAYEKEAGKQTNKQTNKSWRGGNIFLIQCDCSSLVVAGGSLIADYYPHALPFTDMG